MVACLAPATSITHIPTRVSAASSRYLCLECQFDSLCFEPAAISAPLKRGARIQSTNSLRRILSCGCGCVCGAAVSPGLLRPQDETHKEKHVKNPAPPSICCRSSKQKNVDDNDNYDEVRKVIDENHTSQHTSTVTWQATSPGSTPHSPFWQGGFFNG